MPRLTLALTAAALFACGPLKDPFNGLTPGGACSQDSDCALGVCPNACFGGAPVCSYPLVFTRAEVERACPCATTPDASSCAAPGKDACGPLPGCPSPADANLLSAACRSGHCARVFPDGGSPP